MNLIFVMSLKICCDVANSQQWKLHGPVLHVTLDAGYRNEQNEARCRLS